MTTIENIKMYSDIMNHPSYGNVILHWSDKMSDLYPWRPEPVLDMFCKNYRYVELSKKFDNTNQIEEIDDLYIITEFDEMVYGHGLFNFCRKIEKYPKNVPILVTNFSNYILEMYDYLRKDGYNIMNIETVSSLIVNKKVHIKKIHFDETPTLVSSGDKHDFSYIRSTIKKPGIAFLRKDAATGINRKLLNSDEVKSLFIKYGFVVIERFSDLSFYEKQMYMNNFKNIFIEAGCGLINCFLVNNPDKMNIFNMQSPSYDSSYVYSNIRDIVVTNLEFGELAIDSELYGNKIDPCNEPWRMNLTKLEEKLRELI